MIRSAAPGRRRCSPWSGVINLPIIKFSVDWWSTLHQPSSILKLGGPTIHTSMLWPLLLMIAGFMAYFVTVLILRSRAGLLAQRRRALQLRQLGARDMQPV